MFARRCCLSCVVVGVWRFGLIVDGWVLLAMCALFAVGCILLFLFVARCGCLAFVVRCCCVFVGCGCVVVVCCLIDVACLLCVVACCLGLRVCL